MCGGVENMGDVLPGDYAMMKQVLGHAFMDPTAASITKLFYEVSIRFGHKVQIT